jgi:hypothetical protein
MTATIQSRPGAPTRLSRAQHTQLSRELSRAAAGVRGARALRPGSALTPTAAKKVMEALWPYASPHASGRADWWRTDLGIAVAGALASAPKVLRACVGDDAVTQAEAADILGVQRGSISSYLQKGYIQRGSVTRDTQGHIGGGTVSLSSVLDRVAKTAAKQRADG